MALALLNSSASAITPQQKDKFLNPFELQDSQIRFNVYLTHVNDDKEYDGDVLFNLVSNILNSASAQVSATAVISVHKFIYNSSLLHANLIMHMASSCLNK